MKQFHHLSRKSFFKELFSHTVSLAFFGLLNSQCSSGSNEKQSSPPTDPCEDLSGLSELELKKRENLGYVRQSPLEESQCSNCNLYLPEQYEGDCGGCTLFRGPVYPDAYCTYWAPKV